MAELLRTNDPVLLSFAEAVLREAGFQPLVADTHMSILDGSIGALPRRLLVPDEVEAEARAILDEALSAVPVADPEDE
jgi:hypothetical protein